MVHRKKTHLGVRIVGQQLAFADMGIGHDLRRVLDRPDGDLGLLEEGDVFLLRADPDDAVQLIGMLQPVRIGAKAGSPTSSGRPMARNSRSVIFWVEPDRLT